MVFIQEHHPIRRLTMVAALVGVIWAVGLQAQDRRHERGQGVTPSFEGWFKNPDGSFGLVFGYFNRNFSETIDIPVGQNNRLEPGSPDQGQPTHFLPRRQVGVFTIKVPADFDKKTVTWTLVNQGGKFAIPGYLRPEWEITPFEEPTDGQKPPKLRFAREGAAIEGPIGGKITMTARVNEPATLNVWVEPGRAEELKEANRPGRPEGTPLEWTVFRGEAPVQFANARPKMDGTSLATTTVTFTAPGKYAVRLQAGNAQTRGCCWTNGYVEVDVQPAGSR